MTGEKITRHSGCQFAGFSIRSISILTILPGFFLYLVLMGFYPGILEVELPTYTILAQIAERADEIDLARAESARKRAEERLSTLQPDLDFERARIALMKSLIRIQVASRARVRG